MSVEDAAGAEPLDGAGRGDVLLAMTGIRKEFNGVPALRDASFEVRRGEVHALIGQNGAGKSTLIKILTGVYDRDAGEILFEGRPVSFSKNGEHVAAIDKQDSLSLQLVAE